MTVIYLAYSSGGDANKTYKELNRSGVRHNILVAFPYLRSYHARQPYILKNKSILDSGAFSVWKSGKTINIDALIEESKNPEWNESICLDVINNANASIKNSLYMKSQGSPAYPVFHFGDPWEHLQEYKRQFPKVGLSCRFGEPLSSSLAWLDRCFALAWPYKFHSFGWVAESMLVRFPFQTADTASWNNAPCVYGQWKTFGQMSVRHPKSLRSEVEWYQRLQSRLEARWKTTLTKLA
jgi:hypothetical protein